MATTHKYARSTSLCVCLCVHTAALVLIPVNGMPTKIHGSFAKDTINLCSCEPERGESIANLVCVLHHFNHQINKSPNFLIFISHFHFCDRHLQLIEPKKIYSLYFPLVCIHFYYICLTYPKHVQSFEMGMDLFSFL